jgi:parvulin-like peptidyl-prolyl isomerase
MNTIKPVVAVNSRHTESGVVVTLQSTSILLGILVSGAMLTHLGIKLITNVNNISLSIAQIQKDLKSLSVDVERIDKLDRRLDLHIQDYINRKDVVQMLLGQLDEKINHKFRRLLFYNREMQKFLQRDTTFQIREYEESKEDE